MTLVEFIAPLTKGTNQDRVLAVLYFRERYEDKKSLTTDEIRTALKSGKAKNWSKVNVADVVAKSGAYTQEGGLSGSKHSWSLTDSGRDRVRDLLALPKADVEVEHDVGTLQALIGKVSEPDVRDYLQEAVKVLQVGALRACIVFTWAATIRKIQTDALDKYGSAAVSAAILVHDQKARKVNKIEDFAYVKEAIVLLAVKDLGLFDKSEKDALGDALDLRNKCGHPSKYRPGVKKVAAFIEDVVTIVFK